VNLRRIWALILRHLYTWRRSLWAVTDLFYWPLIDLLIFGMIATYFARREGAPVIIGWFVAALVLWAMFWHVQQAISVSFLWEIWSRNLLNLFVSPLTLREFVAAMMVFGLIKIVITGIILVIAAWLLYHFSIFTLGFALVPFIIGLIGFGWAIGIVVTGLLLRFGLGVETLAWSLGFFFQPFGAVFFPMSVYPEWLQRVLWLFPLPHIFEGMRAVLRGEALDARHLAWAYALDAVALAASFAFFAAMFRTALRRGSLLKTQE